MDEIVLEMCLFSFLFFCSRGNKLSLRVGRVCLQSCVENDSEAYHGKVAGAPVPSISSPCFTAGFSANYAHLRGQAPPRPGNQSPRVEPGHMYFVITRLI